MRTPRRPAASDDAVTPVIGSILILGITVLGITAVTVWGVPALQELQEQNSQASMLGEFRLVRADSLQLTIRDTSRIPSLTIAEGTLAVEPGTRTMVTSQHYGAKPTCDMHVTDWGDTDVNEISVTFENCGTVDVDIGGACANPCFRIFEVANENTFEVTITATDNDNFDSDATAETAVIEVASQQFDTGDWLFQLDNGGVTSYAQAWLLDSDALVWELQGNVERTLRLEQGAIFSTKADTIFLEEEPALSEQAFGTDDFVLRIPTYSGNSVVHSGPANPTLFMQLDGNTLRTSETEAYKVRLDWEGGDAQGWCNTMKLRNSDLTGAAVYTEATGYTCDGSQTRKSLIYTPDATAACSGNDCFGFEFIHATIDLVL